LIRDFPAEMLVLTALHEILFEENGAAGVGNEDTRCGQEDIAGAILHLNPASEKRGIAGHMIAVCWERRGGSIVRTFPYYSKCGNNEVEEPVGQRECAKSEDAPEELEARQDRRQKPLTGIRKRLRSERWGHTFHGKLAIRTKQVGLN
jgi:hypothetical protein